MNLQPKWVASIFVPDERKSTVAGILQPYRRSARSSGLVQGAMLGSLKFGTQIELAVAIRRVGCPRLTVLKAR